MQVFILQWKGGNGLKCVKCLVKVAVCKSAWAAGGAGRHGTISRRFVFSQGSLPGSGLESCSALWLYMHLGHSQALFSCSQWSKRAVFFFLPLIYTSFSAFSRTFPPLFLSLLLEAPVIIFFFSSLKYLANFLDSSLNQAIWFFVASFHFE